MVKSSELTFEEKIGQLFMIGIKSNGITKDVIEMIQKYKIGGFILYRKNYKNYEEMLNLIIKLKTINKENRIPLFIAIDQEGGRVNRMPPEFKNIKSPAKLISKNDINIIRESATTISKMLYESGINMNIAPVLDIQRFPDNHPIGDRCYGKNKEEVCKYGIEMMKEMKKNNIISVIKHFPGHGATKEDSHYGLPIISKKIQELEKEDIVPFKKGIDEGADCIMVGHLIVKDIDKIYPISLSKKFIKEYLREKLNFNGVVITDDIKMKAISFFYGGKYATIRALNVGNDIVMTRISYQKQKKVLEKLLRQKNNLKIDEKVNRILNLKEKYNISDDLVKGCNIKEINEIIENINHKV